MNQAALFHNGTELDCEGYKRSDVHFELTFKDEEVTLTNTNEFSFGMMQFEGKDLTTIILDEEENPILFFDVPYHIYKWDEITYQVGSINVVLPDQTVHKKLRQMEISDTKEDN